MKRSPRVGHGSSCKTRLQRALAEPPLCRAVSRGVGTRLPIARSLVLLATGVSIALASLAPCGPASAGGYEDPDERSRADAAATPGPAPAPPEIRGPRDDAADAPASAVTPQSAAPETSVPPATSETKTTANAAALDPRARLSKGGSASEQWDLVARLASGHRVFARFLVTNLGPGEQSGVAIGHLITPGGEAHEFHNGRTRDGWKLEHDRAYLNIGSSELDLRSPAFRLDVDKDHLLIDLPFAPEGAHAIPPEALPPGYRSELLSFAAPTRARVWIPSMAEPVESEGWVTFSHSWMDEAEGDLVLRRLEIVGQGEEGGVYASQVRGPDGEQWTWVADRSADGSPTGSSEVDLSGEGETPHSRGSRYVVPSGLRFKGDRVSGDVLIEGILLEHDPLGDLPQPFRFLVSLSMRPFRVWATARIDVTLRADREDPPLPVSVPGVAVVTFLNPASDP